MTSRTLPKLSGVAIALLLALGAAGCSEDPKPKHAAAHPTPTASATRDEPEKPEAPEMSDAAKAHTKAGAKAFGEYFVKTVSFTSQTLETRAFNVIADAHCEPCNNVIVQHDRWHRRGASSSGGKYSLRSVNVKAISDKVAIVDVTTHVDRQVVKLPSGKVLFRGTPGTVRMQLVLNPLKPNGWTITSLVVKQ